MVIMLSENSFDRKVNKFLSGYTGGGFSSVREFLLKGLYGKLPEMRCIKNPETVSDVVRWFFNPDGSVKNAEYVNDFRAILKSLIDKEGVDKIQNFTHGFELLSFMKTFGHLTPREKNHIPRNSSRKSVKADNGYTVTRIDSFDEMTRTPFGDSWCIGQDREWWDEFADESVSTVYMVVRSDAAQARPSTMMHDDEEVTADEYFSEINSYTDSLRSGKWGSLGSGKYPYDSYGMSAMAVISYENGMHEVWSRYNMSGKDGDYLSKGQMSRLLGAPFETLFPYVNYTISESALNESEYAYHLTDRASDGSRIKHDMRPYGSEGRVAMTYGRDTGHFGSGTYFSTYTFGGYDDLPKYGEGNNDPHFIQIKDGVYRVDMDLYKNLYRVESEDEADILYSTLKLLNEFFNRVTDEDFVGKKEPNYNNAGIYQVVRRNCSALGLKCPSYYELTRMAQSHKGVQSFSTLFMEWNGFNGVNVCGLYRFDNTMHGSVIYDLSKTGSAIVPVKKARYFSPKVTSRYGYVNTDGIYDDDEMLALTSDYIPKEETFKKMPFNRQVRILKNMLSNGKVVRFWTFDSCFSDKLKKMYLQLVFNNRDKSRYGEMVGSVMLGGEDKYRWREYIVENGLYYWAGYYNNRVSGLTSIMHELDDWNLDDDENKKQNLANFKNLMRYVNRPLELDELKEIHELTGVWFDYDGNPEK